MGKELLAVGFEHGGRDELREGEVGDAAGDGGAGAGLREGVFGVGGGSESGV